MRTASVVLLASIAAITACGGASRSAPPADEAPRGPTPQTGTVSTPAPDPQGRPPSRTPGAVGPESPAVGPESPNADPEPQAVGPESPSSAVGASPYCYLYVGREGTFAGRSYSNCFPSIDACRAGVARTLGEMEGGSSTECRSAAAPFCAVATDRAGIVTFRSCAIDATVCEQQRERAVRAIASGMIAGSEPVCRPARPEDIARPQR